MPVRSRGGILEIVQGGTMQRAIWPAFLILGIAAVVAAASSVGMVEGSFVPPDATAEVSASRNGTVVATVHGDGPDGAFRMQLPPGTYTITVSAAVSSFPVVLDDVVVHTGETTKLSPVLILPGSGKAVLEGRTFPPRPDSKITLLSGGRERATARTDNEGRYEFRELPAGEYEIRASSPGHADDVAPVMVPENQRVQQTSVLLPVAAIDGVDWEAGKIRATGIGSPPREAANAASARAMAQRAAVADAQRNLLRIVKQIKIDGGRTVGNVMATPAGRERIQGFLKGFTVAAERDLGDGRIEVVLELPLSGPAGLSRYVAGQ
jgi:hypothetical protein